MPAPAHFFRLQAINFLARRDSGMGVLIGRKLAISCRRLRHQGRGLGTGRERGRSGRKSKGEFQKVPALHDNLLLCNLADAWKRFSMLRHECSLNCLFRFVAHVSVVPAFAGTHTPCRLNEVRWRNSLA
jgi:hypothetical protein